MMKTLKQVTDSLKKYSSKVVEQLLKLGVPKDSEVDMQTIIRMYTGGISPRNAAKLIIRINESKDEK